jgi:hypothetical protein
MRYRYEVGGFPLALDRLSSLLLETLDEREKPWWAPLGKTGLLGFDDPQQQAWWDNNDGKERARWLLGQLWHYQERLPWEYCDMLELPRASTFAQAARRLWGGLLDDEPEASPGAEEPV